MPIIAYRYAFDHPNERILWMSPSTYIEQEQEASIRRELPNHEFKNIERMTYVWRFSESESDVMTSEFSLFMLGLLAKIKAGTIWKSSLFILSCLSDHQV